MSLSIPAAVGSSPRTSFWKSLPLALMRVAIGWHFLYEGLVKWSDPAWTQKVAGFLEGTTGPLAPYFHALADGDAALWVVAQLNMWGLLLIGGCLILGLATRLAALAGMVMLGLYYVAYPPLFGPPPAAPLEGSYLLVNKNLVEAIALLVVVVFPATLFGLDGILGNVWRAAFAARLKSTTTTAPCSAAVASDTAPARDRIASPDMQHVTGRFSRRHVLAGLAGVPVVGAFVLAVLKKHGWASHEEQHLAKHATDDARHASLADVPADAVTQPSKTFAWSALDDLEGKIPKAKIGNVELSRMILGGNLIGGWAHARDLIYVSKLVKAYHHRDKVFETFRLTEACGVNCILTNPILCDIINDYWANGGGSIQFISDCGGKDVVTMVKKSIDNGACACYVQGATADRLVREKDFKTIVACLDVIRAAGLPAGIGGHQLETVRTCVEEGFTPDFWMKTLHHGNYWSADKETQHDNIWCEEPDDTVAFMRDRPEPWIAFKTLAAGAIHPRQGFRYAFESGADFICVGMYDFQIVDDVNIALAVLDDERSGKFQRQRPWRAAELEAIV